MCPGSTRLRVCFSEGEQPSGPFLTRLPPNSHVPTKRTVNDEAAAVPKDREQGAVRQGPDAAGEHAVRNALLDAQLVALLHLGAVPTRLHLLSVSVLELVR